MGDIRKVGKSGNARNRRVIKVAPMTRAVRSVLAASALTLAIGLGGQASAATRPASTMQAHAIGVVRSPIDFAPVFDLTTLSAPDAVAAHDPAIESLISKYATGDVTWSNSGAINESGTGNMFGIRVESAAGNAGITNTGAITEVSTGGGMAVGLYAYAPQGTASVDNSGAITVTSNGANGVADGIFAYGQSVDVDNSGAITASGLTWAAGIEAQGVDDVTVVNSGALSATASNGGGLAYGLYASGGDVSVHNDGGITARGYYATGIGVEAHGDIAIANTGAISAGSSTTSAIAWGIHASTDGEGAAIEVDNSGAVSAAAIYGATGIQAVSSGYGGTVDVATSGDIVVVQNRAMTSYGAYGVLASADSDSHLDNSGSVTVTSRGPAFGLDAMSFSGEANVTNTGTLTVTSTLNASSAPSVGATGIVGFSGNGSTTVDNSGDVTVTAVRRATGADAQAYGDVTVTNSGDLVVKAGRTVSGARADGVKVISGAGDAHVNNAGSIYVNAASLALGVYAVAESGDVAVDNAVDAEIGFYSWAGRGRGVFAYAAHGDVDVGNAGGIEGYAFVQTYGVLGRAVEGDVTVDTSGGISVSSGNNKAMGVLASAGDTATISNSGDIDVISGMNGYAGTTAYGMFATGAYANVANSGTVEVHGNTIAIGVVAQSTYGTGVTNAGGDVRAYANGNAFGVFASAPQGDVVVDNGSDVVASSRNSAATALRALSVYGDVQVGNTGDLHAQAATNAIAIHALSNAGDVSIGNAGDLYVHSAGGSAIGLYGYSVSGNVSIDNTGDIEVVGGGLADGIFASGADVDVTNAGGIRAMGGTWAAGIEAQGAGTTTVQNDGDVYALATAAGGRGIGLYATGDAGVTVGNTANVEAQGYYATGIEARSYGDVAIDNAGNVIAGYAYDGTFYSAVATGITATSGGSAATVAVTSSGDITALGYYGATGISAVSSGEGGVATVDNSGDIAVTQGNKYGYGAYGIVTSADGDSVISNSGDITVQSAGAATGLAALSFAGDAIVVNTGDIAATSTATGYYGGTGIVAFSSNGAATVTNSGSVSAFSSGILSSQARAVDIQAFGDVTVDNTGSLYANGAKYAFGVYASSGTGDVAVANAGDIGFDSYLGRGWGVFGIATQGDVRVSNEGVIQGYAYGQSVGVFGVALQGDVDVDNSGSIDVTSGGDAAVGVFARADYGTAGVVNSGDITTSNFPESGYAGMAAYGVIARGAHAQVGNSGDILVDGQLYSAGIVANSVGGSTVVNTGDVEVHGLGIYAGEGGYYAAGTATGIEANASEGDVSVASSGDITVDALGADTTGILAFAAGDVGVTNQGDITVATEYGRAAGIDAVSVYGGDVSVTSTGSVVVNGYAQSYGLSGTSEADGSVTIANAGDVYAASAGVARGVFAYSYYGNATVTNAAGGSVDAAGNTVGIGVNVRTLSGSLVVNNAGDIHAAGPGSAIGVLMDNYALAPYGAEGWVAGTSTLNNSGSIRVDGVEGYAWAVMGDDVVDTINNTGRIAGAVTLFGGDDVFNNKSGGTWTVGDTRSTDFGDGNDTLTNAAGGTITIDEGAIAFGAGSDTLNNVGLMRLTNGTITMGDIGPMPTLVAAGAPAAADVNAFNNSGTLRIVGSSLIDTAGGVFTNTGLVDFANGVTTDVLNVSGTLAGSGRMTIDMDPDGRTTDHLVVEGDVASGVVQRVNVRFTGLPTALAGKIDFAHVSGTSAAGNFVAGDIIGYDQNVNFLTLGLGVTSALNAANSAADVFSVALTVDGLSNSGTLAASSASGAAMLLNSQVGTFRQRLGVNPYGDDGKVLSAFFRAYSEQGDVNPNHVAGNFGQGGNFAYEQTSWGREVGVNANLFGNFHAGLVAGTADGRQRLADAGAGVNRMDGTTFGAYATWYVPGSFYVDVSGRSMATDIRSTSAGSVLESRARSNAVSVEAGYEWKLGAVNMVPQVQYTRTRVEDVRTFHGEQLDFVVDGGTFQRARLGVEFNRTFQAGNFTWTPYGSINAVRDAGGKTSYRVGQFYGETGISGNRAMAEFGLGVQKGGFGVTLGVDWTDGNSMKSVVGGQANLRYSW